MIGAVSVGGGGVGAGVWASWMCGALEWAGLAAVSNWMR